MIYKMIENPDEQGKTNVPGQKRKQKGGTKKAEKEEGQVHRNYKTISHL